MAFDGFETFGWAMMQEQRSDSLCYTHLFPLFRKSTQTKKRYEVVLSIGGNQKNTIHCFHTLIHKLKQNRYIRVLSTSPLYHNPPFGFLEQAWFYNAIIRITTNWGYKSLFAYTSYLERILGRPRKRCFKNAPRVLDIDIITFDSLKINTPTLTIPHKAWQERQSVILPLLLEIQQRTS